MHRLLTYLVALLVLAGFTYDTAQAQQVQEGAAGAAYLLIPHTAQTASLGMAVSGGLASMNGIEAMLSNPAGLTQNAGTSGLFSYMDYAADIGVSTVGVAQSIGNNDIALIVSAWDFGDIPLQTEDRPDITDLSWEASNIVVGAAYARQFTDRIAAGVTAKLLSEEIHTVSATGVVFDAGIQYTVGETGLKFGVSLQNFGPEMSFSGDGLQRNTDEGPLNIEAQSHELPSELDFGFTYTRRLGGELSATVLGNFRSNSYDEDELGGALQLGLRDILYVRGGYAWSESLEESFFTGANVGAGLNLDFAGTTLTVDYGYRATDFFSNVHLVTASFSL
jgi:hypothetical protein